MRASVVSIAVAATAVLADCGSSGSAKTDSPPATPAATSATSSQSASATPAAAPGVTGQAICDAVPASQVEAALDTRVADGTADDSTSATHACGWIGANGKGALVAVVFDNSTGHKAFDSQLKLTNGIAGTHFTTVGYIANDVLDHEVTVYLLSNDAGIYSTSGLRPIGGSVGDLVRQAG